MVSKADSEGGSQRANNNDNNANSRRASTSKQGTGKKTQRKNKNRNAAKSASSRRSFLGVLSSHRRDLWGLGIILLGLLSAASLWFGAARPVGGWVDDGLAATVGMIRFVVPIGLLALGVTLILGTIAEATAEWPTRLTVGGTLLLISLTGLFHVLGDRPGLNDTIDALGAAGGVLGLAIGGALYAATALTGAILILVLLGVVGLIVVTRTSARTLGRILFMIVVPPLRWLKTQIAALIKSLFSDVSKSSGSSGTDASQSQATPTRVEVTGGEDFGAVVPGAIRATESGDGGDGGSNRDDADDATEKTGPANQPDGSQADGSQATSPHRNRAKKQIDPGVVTEQKLPLELSNWTLPPTSLLARSQKQEIDTIDVVERGKRLQETLAQFGVETTLLDPIVGPTVTRYVLTLGEGVKVTKFESLRKDMAYAMASPDVRILAPIPGRRAIGVEVPNNKREIVTIGDILATSEAQHATHPLEVAIGRDINGQNVLVNVANMPHVLIAGATGSGKSSCLNSLLSSILMRSTPDQVRMILVDPKRVEMGQYDRIPHLLTAPVTDPRKAANALAWAVREMDRRYDLLASLGVRDISGYNEGFDNNTLKPPPGATDENGEPLAYKRLPFVLVVVDELADLMMVAARDVEDSIARIAQMARAVGIHLVIATQRPSVNVITGVIKANIPSRWAFAVSSLTDSRVILDQPGAERLVGGGDLLMLGTSSSALHRIQGCWVEESEVRAIVEHWREQAKKQREAQTESHESVSAEAAAGSAGSLPVADEAITSGTITHEPITDDTITDSSLDLVTASASPTADESDELLAAAMQLVVETQLGSTSMLQRKLRVGFARAGRIMDLLEQKGVVGPSTGSKAREVLVSAEELEARQSVSTDD